MGVGRKRTSLPAVIAHAPHEVILARYELCEDMACMLTEHAQKLAFDEEMEQKVLRQCHS